MWWGKVVSKKIKEKKRAFRRFIHSSSTKDLEQYGVARDDLKRLLGGAKG